MLLLRINAYYYCEFIKMSPLTVTSFTKALEKMEAGNEQIEVWLMVTMEVGHELMVTIAVTNEVLIIAVVGKVQTSNKQ